MPAEAEVLADWGEFAFIDYLRSCLPQASSALPVGPGDDAACWRPPAGGEILTTTDLLVEGVHFKLEWTSAADLGYKALAVNLSDIAAMGGCPACAYLGLALPSATRRRWLMDFCDGLLAAAREFGVDLAGGDTVRARELVIAVTINGRAERSLLRRGAVAGDDLYVSGTIGDSALGLGLLRGDFTGASLLSPDQTAWLKQRHLRPVPRLALGQRLAAIAGVRAMLDVSDGLLADLKHLLAASGGLGVLLDFADSPWSEPAARLLRQNLVTEEFLLSGGEDYELLFTADSRERQHLAEVSREAAVALHRIGTLRVGPGVFRQGLDGPAALAGEGGYDHFRT